MISLFDVIHIAATSATTDGINFIPEQGSDLGSGTVLMDGDYFTFRARLHDGLTSTFSFLTTTLLDTGSPASFVSTSVVDSTTAAGELSDPWV